MQGLVCFFHLLFAINKSSPSGICFVHLYFLYVPSIVVYQLMVNWWFGARWFGFLGFPCERDCCLGVSLESQTTGPQSTNLQYISLSVGFLFRHQPCFFPCMFHWKWSLPHYLQIAICTCHVTVRYVKITFPLLNHQQFSRMKPRDEGMFPRTQGMFTNLDPQKKWSGAKTWRKTSRKKQTMENGGEKAHGS